MAASLGSVAGIRETSGWTVGKLGATMRPPGTASVDTENPDIWEEACEVAGDDWIRRRNDRLGGCTPESIDAGDESLVRDP